MPTVGGMLCAFEFPRCAGCTLNLHPQSDVFVDEDPLKSNIFHHWTQSLGMFQDRSVGLDDFGLNAAAPSRWAKPEMPPK
jgi:hypothetical protein